MNKEQRDLLNTISQFNSIVDKKKALNNKGVPPVEEITKVLMDLDQCKNKLKNQMSEYGEEQNIYLDVDGYCHLKEDNNNLENDDKKGTLLFDGSGFEGGKTMGNKKFRMFNKADELKKAYKNEKGLDLGKYVRGSLNANWKDAELEKLENSALSTGTGIVMIPQALSAEILSNVMNKSLIYGSGVPMVDMPNGNLTIAKVTKNPDVAFKGEGQLAAGITFDSTKGTYSTGTAEFAGISLKSKTIFGICKVSDEVLNSAENLTEVLTQAFSEALADGIDKACIYGTGTKNTDGTDNPNPQILGIANTAGIKTVSASGDISTVHYVPFVQAVGAIRKANGEPTTLGINSDTDTALNLLTNGNGDPLGVPQVVNNLNHVVSNNLRNNLGTGTNESEALVFDPTSMIIGQQIQVAFQVSNQALDGFGTGSTYFRIYSMLDFAVLRPEYITRITGLK